VAFSFPASHAAAASGHRAMAIISSSGFRLLQARTPQAGNWYAFCRIRRMTASTTSGV